MIRHKQHDWTELKLDGLKRAHILESDDIDRLLVLPGRRLLGRARQETAYNATVTWVEALNDRGFLPADPADLCTLTVLAEGVGHNLPMALGVVLEDRFHNGDNWIGVSRFALPEQQEHSAFTEFSARVSYLRIHSNASVWLMLDTIATGATLIHGLEAALANVDPPEKILLGTPAGSLVGTKRVVEFLEKKGIDVHVTFWGAAFGLWNDGTGLPWCHPETVVSGTRRAKHNLDIAGKLFNNLPGFCAVGDCSSNFFDVKDARRVLAEEEERFGWRLPELDEVEVF